MKKVFIISGLIFIIIFSFLINQPLMNLDELWNYSFSKNIADGLVPYKDFNLVTTPFLFMVTSIFLKFIFNGLITTKVLGAVLGTAILVMVYLVLSKLIKNKYINLFITLNVGLLMIPFWIFSYNFVILLLTLIILNYELKSKDEGLLKLNVKNDFFVGIIAGLAIITKQSTGFLIAATYVGYKWLAIRGKNDFVLALKISLSRGLGVLVPVIIFFIYLLANNALWDFFDLCFLGISEFKNYISYFTLLNLSMLDGVLFNEWGLGLKFWFVGKVSLFIIIAILASMMFLVIPFAIVYLIRNFKFDSVESKNVLKLFVFGVASFLLLYPIADYNHFVIGALIFIILAIYIVSLHIRISNEKVKKYLNRLIIIVLAIVMLFVFWVTGRNYYEYINNDDKNHNLKHYTGVIFDKGRVEQISTINKFIEEEEAKGNKVYMINSECCLYNMPRDAYEKYFDLLVKGNLGQNGVDKVIEKIKGLDENTLFLVFDESVVLNWQFPSEVVDFIRSNYKEVGSITNYDIYSKAVE